MSGPESTTTPVFCDHCGEPLDTGVHDTCSRRRRLEPPRYCARCRRRMVVQVVPRGWTARCVEHGEIAAHQDGAGRTGQGTAGGR